MPSNSSQHISSIDPELLQKTANVYVTSLLEKLAADDIVSLQIEYELAKLEYENSLRSGSNSEIKEKGKNALAAFNAYVKKLLSIFHETATQLCTDKKFPIAKDLQTRIDTLPTSEGDVVKFILKELPGIAAERLKNIFGKRTENQSEEIESLPKKFLNKILFGNGRKPYTDNASNYCYFQLASSFIGHPLIKGFSFINNEDKQVMNVKHALNDAEKTLKEKLMPYKSKLKSSLSEKQENLSALSLQQQLSIQVAPEVQEKIDIPELKSESSQQGLTSVDASGVTPAKPTLPSWWRPSEDILNIKLSKKLCGKLKSFKSFLDQIQTPLPLFLNEFRNVLQISDLLTTEQIAKPNLEQLMLQMKLYWEKTLGQNYPEQDHFRDMNDDPVRYLSVAIDMCEFCYRCTELAPLISPRPGISYRFYPESEVGKKQTAAEELKRSIGAELKKLQGGRVKILRQIWEDFKQLFSQCFKKLERLTVGSPSFFQTQKISSQQPSVHEEDSQLSIAQADVRGNSGYLAP